MKIIYIYIISNISNKNNTSVNKKPNNQIKLNEQKLIVIKIITNLIIN